MSGEQTLLVEIWLKRGHVESMIIHTYVYLNGCYFVMGHCVLGTLLIMTPVSHVQELC